MENKFKVGDVVRVIADISEHFIPIGDKVKIIASDNLGYEVKLLRRRTYPDSKVKMTARFLDDDEIELA